MLQRDGLFRRREESLPRSPSAAPQPAPPATSSPSVPVPPVASNLVKPPIVEKPVEQPQPAERREARLTVGPEIKMKGAEIIDCDTLVVEGRLEATLDTRVLQIAEHGSFNGVVSVDVAEIHGRLDGELTARKQLIVHGTARVSGKIRYLKIQVSEGAEISGEIGLVESSHGASTVRTGQAAFAGQRTSSSS
jgi:cytoskeletal protein CcmA (bactofilin family)